MARLLRVPRLARRLGFVLAIALSARPAIVSAQPAAKPAAKETKEETSPEYRRHMENGVKLYKAGDFDAALAEFDAAYKAEPKASALVNIALCQREAKKYPDAIRTLERALADHGASMDRENKDGANKAIEEMRALLGFVTVKASPPTARVSIDGVVVGEGAHAVAPGSHTIVAEAEGFATKSIQVTTVSQEQREIAVSLDALAGTLKILARSASTVILVDGQKKGTWSWSGSLPAGKHTVELVGEGAPRTVTIERDKETVIDDRPRVPARPTTEAPPPAEEPSGFYGMITGAILVPFRHPLLFEGASVSSGANAGLRAGYRVNTYAGFEGMVEYGNITNSVPAAGSGPDPEYSFTSWRVGPMLRLMSPGETIRFVGALGGGLAIDLMSYDDLTTCAPRCDDTYGIDFYITTDAGTEISIGGVLLGASLTFTVNGTKGSDDFTDDETKALRQPYENRVLPMFGPRVHFGYAFW